MSRPFEIFKLAKANVLKQWQNLTSNPAGVKLKDFPSAFLQATVELFSGFGTGALPADLITIAGSINDQILVFLTTLNYRAEEFPNLAFQSMNPNTAVGYPNDAISALSGAFREPARATQFIGVVTGSANLVIPSLSLVISTNNANNKNYTYINPETITLNSAGKANAVFVCQTNGETPLAPNVQWVYDSFIQGLSSVTNTDINQITIGNDATTDPQLKVKRQVAINRRANCGMDSIEGSIVSDPILSQQITTALVVINNSSSVHTYPDNSDVSAVYTLPAYTVCVAVAMPNIDANKQALAEILQRNITGCNTGYPIESTCPEGVKKYVDYQRGRLTKRFYYIVPQPVNIQFLVTYRPIGFIDPDMEKKIKTAIITQFNDGTLIDDERVVGGVPFYVETFAASIQDLRLYNSLVQMKIENGEFAKTLCTPIWQLPVCTEDNISVVTK